MALYNPLGASSIGAVRMLHVPLATELSSLAQAGKDDS